MMNSAYTVSKLCTVASKTVVSFVTGRGLRGGRFKRLDEPGNSDHVYRVLLGCERALGPVEVSGYVSMAFVPGSCWGISCALLAVNFVMSLIIAGTAGWAFNKNMDQVLRIADIGDNVQSAVVASYFLPLALVASVVGMGSILAGIYHLRVWRTDSLAAAVSVAEIAWLLSMLAAGVALKEIHVGGMRSSKLKVVEAFSVLLPLFEFYYLLSLHAAVLFSGSEGGTPHTTTSKETQTYSEKIDVVVEDEPDHAGSD